MGLTRGLFADSVDDSLMISGDDDDILFKPPVGKTTAQHQNEMAIHDDDLLQQQQSSISKMADLSSKSSHYSTSSSLSSSSSSSSPSSSSSLNRVRRDRSMIIKAERLTDKDGKKSDIVYMDCLKNTAKCVEIRCDIFNMHRKTEAYIRVKARLWNSTLTADYPRVDSVNIISRAQIVVPKAYNIQQNETDDTIVVETRAYPELLDGGGDSSVPLWVYIVSGIAGLFLVLLLCYVLYRCGFFKRRRPDPTLSGNLEKKSAESKPMLRSYS